MTIKTNMVVGIEYTLQDANTKEQLDTNVGGAPLEYIAGKGHIIPGLESKLEGLEEGAKIDVVVESKDAYGEVNQEAIQTLPVEQFAGIELKEGMSLYGTGENGETVQVMVKTVGENDVTIDYNHPMAGKTLMFTVSIVSLREATAEEIELGVVGGAAAMDSCGCGSNDGGCGSHEESKKEESGCCGGGHCS
jgi:FKBP-type peptidyl-prolyl cis-trans isomerase SlyD